MEQHSRPGTRAGGIRLITAVLATTLLAAGCSAAAGAPQGQSLGSAPLAATVSPSAESSGQLPEGTSVAGPDGWRDEGTDAFHHWLAPEVATDPTAERWADIAMYVPTLAYDPVTGAPGPVPADLPGWMRDSRMFRVLDEGTAIVDGLTGTRLDLEFTERAVNVFGNPHLNLISGSGDDGPGYERFVLVPWGDTWVVVQASTLRGQKGMTGSDGPRDALAGLLASIDLPDPGTP